MKNIKVYTACKYADISYQEVMPGIYMYEDGFVTSLCFEQEPGLGEGKSAADISQYPIEDVLERYCVHISDFYPKLNTEKSAVCYIEFSGRKLEYIKSLLTIVGKRVYNKDIYENGESCTVLIIE